MIPRTWLVLGALAVAILLGVGFCWKRDQDIKTDARLEHLEKQRVVDSLARVQAEARSDSLLQVVEQAAANQARVDTVWRTRSTTIIREVHAIAADTAIPDSVKVPQLVAKADSLKAWGDSVADAGNRLRGEVGEVKGTLAAERLAWKNEKATMEKQIALLKGLSRHWGLGVAGGYGVTRVRLPSGQTILATGPQLTGGVVYRW